VYAVSLTKSDLIQICIKHFNFLLLRDSHKPASISVKIKGPLAKDGSTESWSRPRHLVIKPCFHNRKGFSNLTHPSESWRRIGFVVLLCTTLASFFMLTCLKVNRTAEMLNESPRNLRVIDYSCSVSQLNTTTMPTINMLRERHLRLSHMHAVRRRSIRI
jgi:hypothetical protein